MNVWLCDLSHHNTDSYYSSEFVPYAIGNIGAYLLKKVKGVNLRLFKDADTLNHAMMNDTWPDVVGFSSYLWNTKLSHAFAKRFKEISSKTAIIFGGPEFPLEPEAQDLWLGKHWWVNCYLRGEGEAAFANVVSAVAADSPMDHTYRHRYNVFGIDGVNPQDIIKTDYVLDDIPSPYLTGLLDEFLECPHKQIPLIECSRGCPFTCSFCVDGNEDTARIRHHSPDRLMEEIEYIRKRTTTSSLMISDANFGRYKSNLEFARRLGEFRSNDPSQWPTYINASTSKDLKNRVIEVSDWLDGALRVAASVQSLDPDVLEEIGRKNVPVDNLLDVAKATSPGNTYSEVIFGLPGDTLEKHISGVCQLIDMGFDQVRMHQLIMLNGSELATAHSRRKHGMQTSWRSLQRCYGDYDAFGTKHELSEVEEVVIASNTFSVSDYIKARAFGLSVALFYNDGCFKELVGFFKHIGESYSKFLLHLHNKFTSPDGNSWLHREYSRFIIDSILELDPSGGKGVNLLFSTKGIVWFKNYYDLALWVVEETLRYLTPSPAYTLTLLHLEELMVAKRNPQSILDGETRRLSTGLDVPLLEDSGWTEGWPVVREGEPLLRNHHVIVDYYSNGQSKFLRSLVEMYGTSDDGLGKIIARAPLNRIEGKVSYANN